MFLVILILMAEDLAGITGADGQGNMIYRYPRKPHLISRIGCSVELVL